MLPVTVAAVRSIVSILASFVSKSSPSSAASTVPVNAMLSVPVPPSITGTVDRPAVTLYPLREDEPFVAVTTIEVPSAKLYVALTLSTPLYVADVADVTVISPKSEIVALSVPVDEPVILSISVSVNVIVSFTVAAVKSIVSIFVNAVARSSPSSPASAVPLMLTVSVPEPASWNVVGLL